MLYSLRPSIEPNPVSCRRIRDPTPGSRNSCRPELQLWARTQGHPAVIVVMVSTAVLGVSQDGSTRSCNTLGDSHIGRGRAAVGEAHCQSEARPCNKHPSFKVRGKNIKAAPRR
jgi:hypothetical protein